MEETLSVSHCCLMLVSYLRMRTRKFVPFLPHSSCGSLLPRHRASISMVYNVLLGHITHSVGSRCIAVWYPCPSCPLYSSEWHYLQLKDQREFQIPPSPLLLQQELIALLILSSLTLKNLLSTNYNYVQACR